MMGLIFLMLLGVFATPFVQRETREAERAIKAYKNRDYIEALTRFQKAQAAAVDPSRYDFNLGVAAQQAKSPNAALAHYLKACGAGQAPPGHAEYNMGNALAELEKPTEALAAFRKALRADPQDADARYNYEVLLRQSQPDSSQEGDQDDNSQSRDEDKSQKKKSEEQRDQSNQNDQQDSQGQPQPQQPDDQGQSEEQKTKQQQAQPNPASEDDGDSQGSQEAQPIPLDKQEAERLLNALVQGERDLLKSRIKGNRRKRVEKDW